LTTTEVSIPAVRVACVKVEAIPPDNRQAGGQDLGMTDPGRSTVAHLRENVAGAALELPAAALAELGACPVEESVRT
jgi:hypothetical protein